MTPRELDISPLELIADLRGMTGHDHVGMTAHRAAEHIEELRTALSLLLYAVTYDYHAGAVAIAQARAALASAATEP
jgi:hypothetical protein